MNRTNTLPYCVVLVSTETKHVHNLTFWCGWQQLASNGQKMNWYGTVYNNTESHTHFIIFTITNLL